MYEMHTVYYIVKQHTVCLVFVVSTLRRCIIRNKVRHLCNESKVKMNEENERNEKLTKVEKKTI